MRRLVKYVSLTALLLSLGACSKVPVGNVGIEVNNMGSDKGVQDKVLTTGWYFMGPTNSLYTFPTYMQNYVWSKNSTEGSSEDESITFQTKEGLSVNADIGISFQVIPDKVPLLFQTYRQGLDEIRDVYLRNMVRDALVIEASTRSVESVYGAGKADLIRKVQDDVNAKIVPLGVKIVQLSWVGDLRLPQTVVDAINAKIQATQQAQQRENEVATAEAQAQIAVAEADGKANAEIAVAKGDAQARTIRAQAEAEANQKIAQSLTPELVQYEGVKQWNGTLPSVTGAATPFIKVGN